MPLHSLSTFYDHGVYNHRSDHPEQESEQTCRQNQQLEMWFKNLEWTLLIMNVLVIIYLKYDICRLSMMERLNRVPHMYSLCFGYSRLPLLWSIILSVKMKGS